MENIARSLAQRIPLQWDLRSVVSFPFILDGNGRRCSGRSPACRAHSRIGTICSTAFPQNQNENCGFTSIAAGRATIMKPRVACEIGSSGKDTVPDRSCFTLRSPKRNTTRTRGPHVAPSRSSSFSESCRHSGISDLSFNMPNSSPRSKDRRHWLRTLTWGFIAGVMAGLAMLLMMALLRLFLGWPTPTELIFDRLFPLLTVEFFISSLVRAGGYTPLKLQGVFGVLAGQVIVAGLGGVIYAFYLKRRDQRDGAQATGTSLLDGRGWSLLIPGVLAATILFVVLLWPTLFTNYRGLPPATAHWVAALEMLISFSVCGLGIMFFYGLLSRRPQAVIADKTAAAVDQSVG